MHAREPYVRPVMMAFATCLWPFQALGIGVVEGRPLIGAAMVLLAVVFFQTVGWDIFLPMRDYSCRVTPPVRAATVPVAMPPLQNADEEVPSPNRSRGLAANRISRLQLQQWPCAPTLH